MITRFVVYCGKAKPVVVTGKHCCRLAMFAEKYRGWHTIGKDRDTRRAVAILQRKLVIEVTGDQFRWQT